MYIFRCTHIYLCICTYVYVCKHIYTCIYIYMYMYSNAQCQDRSNRVKFVIALDIPCGLYHAPPTISCQACRVTKSCRLCQPFERNHVGRVVRVGGQAARRLCNQNVVPSGWCRGPLKWLCLGRVSRAAVKAVSAMSCQPCQLVSAVSVRSCCG